MPLSKVKDRERKRKEFQPNSNLMDIKNAIISTPKEAIMSNPERYPAIVYALVDPVKREKLERICKSLDKKLSDGSNLLNLVHYGTNDYIPMSRVKELLDATA